MRLTAIKLAGFKSFVEPTTVKFPSNLMGIVGPNGCGKSNIIDAVRWVMGESSARQLRGESMSDVIFSGSSSRKPVATATVELTFDNADGRAGGEYASYSEISVRRQVSRDGQSNYFLNGSRCRRKDITDLFLGTGLGPRSYAIIEQGMISQIVEARPEELRGFLEEAAGISRYKERRRETENRIRHTRENLERLADLREEVAKQLAKLKRQARAAERYKELKSRYREDEARLTALRWRQAKGDTEQQSHALKETETRLQAVIAEQREAEKALESLREQQHQANEKASGVQAELYDVTGQIARLEQSIEHQQDLKRRQQTEHDETKTQLDELQQHLVLDQAQVESITGLIASLEPELNASTEQEQNTQQRLEQAEQALNDAQSTWQRHQAEAGQARQQAELLKLRIEHLDERMNQASERLAQFNQDQDSNDQALQAEREKTRLELEQIVARLSEAEQQDAVQQERIAALREQGKTLQQTLEQLKNARREHQGRLESLRVLNQVETDEADLQDWLDKRSLADAPSVLQQLTVEPAWQRAVETVLGDWLAARMTDQALPSAVPNHRLGLVQQRDAGAREGRLSSVVQGAGALTAMLDRVTLADSVEQAYQRLAQLEAGESVITPDGVWLGQGWMWTQGEASEADSRLARQQEIRRLEQELAETRRALEQQQRQAENVQQETEQAHALQVEQRRTLDQLKAERARLAGIQAGQENRFQALERQRAARQQEQQALVERQQADRQAVGEARAELETRLSELEQADAAQQAAEQSRNGQQQQRTECLHHYRQARSQREQHALKLESARASMESLKQAIARIDTQIGQLQSRFVELSEALAQGDEPVRQQKAERDVLLNTRLQVEARLKEAREQLNELEENWRRQDQKRQQSAAGAEQIRQLQSEQQLKLRELEIEVERLAARVVELDADLEQLAGELPDDAEAQAWVDELSRLEQQILRLEPVNLAAIEEYDQESERKEYLDRQHEDLTEALETLEKAIARIDKTTRTRFRETFERVNRNLEELFPRLFGGGHAFLEMVGDDWLTSGTAIMARPPGKRISRIHLLSGGEKALTAVSFVFAIFNLNPAPFCLLDEVDAPLDDANVARFSELVREMSERVQFLFVTHNKVTMEIAHQMLGVTMREPGISRMVSVDLDKAVEMAAS